MAKSRNNGKRTFGHRSSMTPRMKAIPSPRWRMELSITHLYGIMEHLSRGDSRARGAPLHASWPGIRGSITMENGNGDYLFCARGWSITFSSLISQGSWIIINGE